MEQGTKKVKDLVDREQYLQVSEKEMRDFKILSDMWDKTNFKIAKTGLLSDWNGQDERK